MTEIKRYDMYADYDMLVKPEECHVGDWVTYDDHTAELATLRAENERLRDALAHIMSRYEEGTIAYWKAKEALK